MADVKPPRDQRPFHICPECSAHNAKFNKNCWRCNHDMTESALEPTGIMGYRLEQLDSASEKEPETK
ncbi:MAG TPA: hypothetical protein PLF26_04135 [Blastocatellia bacterium]|nr:hypothetical protein [Blastocatellia bacterium]